MAEQGPGMFRIVAGEIRLETAVRAVAGPDRGAVATFSGIARDHHAGKRVLSLEYHAYPEMAERVFHAIGEEVASRFGTPHVAILHRIGRLEIGEVSVLVAVASAHRREAIAGCAHAIERLKAIAPIWKKEYYEGGSTWIEGPDAQPPDG